MRVLSLLAVLFTFALAGCDSGDPVVCDEAGEPTFEDVTPGSGNATATVNSIVTIDYVGRLADGTQFDSGTNVTFSLTNTIPGFRIGVAGMKIGGQRRITIPPNYGYDAVGATDNNGNVVVPPCATLVFEVTLRDVR